MLSESRLALGEFPDDSTRLPQSNREARFCSADCREAPTYLRFPELGSQAKRWRLEMNRRNSESRCPNLIGSIHLVFRTRNGATRCRSSHQHAR